MSTLLDEASLIVTPNGAKTGKLYSVVPSDGSGDLDVTRATTATRVNADGLVELVPYNLFERSEQFENAAWTKSSTTVTANTTIAPNGTLTADTMSVSGGTSRVISTSAVTSGTYTFSAYVKVLSGSGQMRFNITLDGASESSFFVPTSEWQRFQFTFTAVTAASAFAIRGWTFVGNLAIWGAQLVEGTEAKPYLQTTTRLNIPRLDYSNGSCPSILLEPQRTNLALRSEEFENAYWVKTASTITANQVNAPNGTLTADRLKDTIFLGEHNIEKQITITAGTNTFSIFAKKDNNRYFEIGVVNAINSAARFIFDFDTKTITSFGAIGATITYVSSSVTELTDGWFRLSLTYTSNTTNPFFVAGLSNSPNVGTTNLVSYLGDGTKGVYLWGAQVEAGAYPTSYIPTTSASVTRNADVISKTGISSLIGQTEGTIFVDINYEKSPKNSLETLIQLAGASLTNRIQISFGSTNLLITRVTASGSEQASFSGSVTLGRIKVALKYSSSGVKFFINGLLIQSNISAVIPICDRIIIGSTFGASQELNDTINQAILFKTALTDAQCIALTTL